MAAAAAAGELEPGEDSAYAVSTLHFGNLHPDVSVTSLQDLCLLFGAVEHVKVIRDKASGASAGYAFVRFAAPASAQAALDVLRGQPLLGKELRLNWAFQSAPKDDVCHQFNIFVGDLAPEVTDATLYSAFRDTGCCQARVLWDHETGRSKRYGFVAYRSRAEGDAAIVAMQGQYLGHGRVRCRWAQHKQQDASKPLPDAGSISSADASNTNVYVGNVPQTWTDASMSAHFSVFGPLAETRLHKKGGYAFVRFEEHDDAVAAIVATQGSSVNSQVLKCSWGKNVPARSQQSFQEVANAPYFTRRASGTLAATEPPHAHYPSASAGALPWPAGGGWGMEAPYPRFAGAASDLLPTAFEPWPGLYGQQHPQLGWFTPSLPVGGLGMGALPMIEQTWQMFTQDQLQYPHHQSPHQHQQHQQQQHQQQFPLHSMMWGGGGGGGSGAGRGSGGGGSGGDTAHASDGNWMFLDGVREVMPQYPQHSERGAPHFRYH